MNAPRNSNGLLPTVKRGTGSRVGVKVAVWITVIVCVGVGADGEVATGTGATVGVAIVLAVPGVELQAATGLRHSNKSRVRFMLLIIFTSTW